MPSTVIGSDHFSPDIAEFIRLLGKWHVRYLLVGGEAVIFHGYPRLTGDVDFYFDASAENAGRLFETLREFWDGTIPGVNEADDLLETGVIIQFGRPPNRIDLMNTIDGVEFDLAWEERVMAEMRLGTESIPLAYLGLPTLLKNKLASGRPKDLDDHENLKPEI